MAVQLHGRQPTGRNRFLQKPVLRIDKNPDPTDMIRHRGRQSRHLFQADMARAFGKKDKADMACAGFYRRIHCLFRTETTNFDRAHDKEAAISAAARAGSGAEVIGRPMTKMLAPAANASLGVMMRF